MKNPLRQATNITKTMIETHLPAGSDGVYQLERVHKINQVACSHSGW